MTAQFHESKVWHLPLVSRCLLFLSFWFLFENLSSFHGQITPSSIPTVHQSPSQPGAGWKDCIANLWEISNWILAALVNHITRLSNSCEQSNIFQNLHNWWLLCNSPAHTTGDFSQVYFFLPTMFWSFLQWGKLSSLISERPKPLKRRCW